MGSRNIKELTMFLLLNVFSALEEAVSDFNFTSLQLVSCILMVRKTFRVEHLKYRLYFVL